MVWIIPRKEYKFPDIPRVAVSVANCGTWCNFEILRLPEIEHFRESNYILKGEKRELLRLWLT